MSGAHKITTRGIIVGGRAVGDGHARVDFYTEHLGLVRALGTSAREERSKLRAHLQEGTSGLFTFVAGRIAWRVTGAFQTENVYFRSQHPLGASAASRVIGIVRQLVHGEGRDAGLFEVLSGFLRALPALNEKETRDAECLAVLRILSSLGYVETSSGISAFLGPTYSPQELHKARRERPRLVNIINEGISASGL